MDNLQAQEELSIIRNMIEKTRRETAESGQFFIWIGIFTIIFIQGISMLESYKMQHLVFPAMIAMVLINGVVGYLTFSAAEKRERVKTYAKHIYQRLWFSSGMTCLLIVFVLPRLDVVPFESIPILVSLVMGIALYTTGVIFDSRIIRLFSLVWWAGPLIMGFVRSWTGNILMMVIFFGFVVPGIILNRQYKNRSARHESR